MIAPRYIQEGLRAINSMYFAVFNPLVKDKTDMSCGKGRWQIRKWLGVFPRRIDLWDTDASELIFTVCREEFSSERGLFDAGYEDMDRRVLTAIGKSNYWKAQWKKKIADLDWRNEKRERQADTQLEYESKGAAKAIWRNYHEPTVCLSGKEWKV